jgi:hypothetical protein
MAYRSSVHRILEETQNAMVFGHEINLLVSALVGDLPETEYEVEYSSEYVQRLSEAIKNVCEVVRERLGEYYHYQSNQYDRKVWIHQYYIDQAVWMFHNIKTTKTSKKLIQPWTGPHIVVGRVNGVVYFVRLRRGVLQCMHGNRPKPYYVKVHDTYLKTLWIPLCFYITFICVGLWL